MRNSLITFFLIGVSITIVFVFSSNDPKNPIEDSLNKQNEIIEGMILEFKKIKVSIEDHGEVIGDQADSDYVSRKLLIQSQNQLIEDINVVNEKLDRIINGSDSSEKD